MLDRSHAQLSEERKLTCSPEKDPSTSDIRLRTDHFQSDLTIIVALIKQSVTFAYPISIFITNSGRASMFDRQNDDAGLTIKWTWKNDLARINPGVDCLRRAEPPPEPRLKEIGSPQDACAKLLEENGCQEWSLRCSDVEI